MEERPNTSFLSESSHCFIDIFIALQDKKFAGANLFANGIGETRTGDWEHIPRSPMVEKVLGISSDEGGPFSGDTGKCGSCSRS